MGDPFYVKFILIIGETALLTWLLGILSFLVTNVFFFATKSSKILSIDKNDETPYIFLKNYLKIDVF